MTPAWRRWGRVIVRAPLDYRMVLVVLAIGAVTTVLARHQLGPGPSGPRVDRLGFGLPPLLDGRVWTLWTGTFLDRSLTLPLPVFTLIGVVIYERFAGHLRTATVLLATQFGGILIVSALLFPWRNSEWTWARDLAHTIDFGISIGGFGCLGAATAYLVYPLRRWFRVGLACYFPGSLLLSGLIYDLTHPTGYLLGVALGSRLIAPLDAPGSMRRSPTARQTLWGTVVAAALGGVAGVLLGLSGGGSGPFR